MIFGYPASYGDYDSEVMPLEYMFSSVARPLYGVKDVDGISLLVLFGGEDIGTCWYNERPVYSHGGLGPSARERTEVQLIDRCIERGIPILGICRGAQFMCAYLGGKVWQHVDNHAGNDHRMFVWAEEGMEGRYYTTNSYHHQMMIPSPEMEVIAEVLDPLSRRKCSEVPRNPSDEPEAEIVYHAGKKVLMIQGHPEWVVEEHDLWKLTRKLVKDLLCLSF